MYGISELCLSSCVREKWQDMWHVDDKMMEAYTSFGISGNPFPRACPVCGRRHAHVLMHKFCSPDPRGTIWVWCDSCDSYAHFSAVIPVLWSNPEFVDEDRLDSIVDYPDSIGVQIDEWINRLLE